MATEKRLDLIDRKKLFNDLADHWGIPRDWDGRIDQLCEDALGAIEDAPTVDAVPVVHGRWLEDYETFVNDNGYESEPIQTGWVCSACGSHELSARNYCPNCGAKMDLDG